MSEAIEKHNVSSFLMKHSSDFQQVIPSHMSKDRMMRIALSAINTTPHLADCTIQSVAISLMGCSALGLEPNTPLGHAYLIPYNCNVKLSDGKWGKQWRCQLIVGYKGYIELFYRSGLVQNVHAFPVYQGDKFEHTMGTEQKIVHVSSDEPLREIPERMTKAYCVIKMKDLDTPLVHVMSRYEIDKHKERSSSRDLKTKEITGPWVTDYIKMALKTTVRDVVPWVPFSIEKPASAAAFEFSSENRDSRGAINALGSEAIDITGRLLEGVPEDQEAIEAEVVEGGAMENLKSELAKKTKREPGE